MASEPVSRTRSSLGHLAARPSQKLDTGRVTTQRDSEKPEKEKKSGEQDLNLRIIRPLLEYVAYTLGEVVEKQVARAGGLRLEELRAKDHWVSHRAFERILQAARDQMSSDQEFRQACSYELAKSYGPLFLVIRFAALRKAFEHLDKTRHLVSNISRFFTTRDKHPHVIHMQYCSQRPESRLMCLSRQAQWTVLPTTLWGLPPAMIEEESCIGWGDDRCRYTIRWREPFRILPAMIGAALGGIIALVAVMGGGTQWLGAALPLLGAATGLGYSMRSVYKDRKRFKQARDREVERFVDEHVQATEELLQLHHRQQHWTELLEQQLNERHSALESTIEQLNQMREESESVLRSYSHDMRNPLTVITGNASLMRMELAKGGQSGDSLGPVEQILGASDDLSQILVEMSKGLQQRLSGAAETEPTDVIETDALVDRCRRQLQALVLGRDLKISAFKTRDAPESFVTHRLTLDRITDNLFTNAAKYTERGSIIVEVDGTPREVCIKISDTGRGITEQRLASVFEGTTRDLKPEIGDSMGLGLAVVVRLLDTLGGRLEVLSKPGVGTTFWVFVPVDLSQRKEAATKRDCMGDLVQRVVTIRPANDS